MLLSFSTMKTSLQNLCKECGDHNTQNGFHRKEHLHNTTDHFIQTPQTKTIEGVEKMPMRRKVFSINVLIIITLIDRERI